MAVISSPRPHIFIIPGAWHPGSVMDIFIKSLEAAGFSAETTSLRSVRTADVSLQDDEAQVKALLTPLIDKGRDIVVVAHSYGGMVGTGVIAGLDKRRREVHGLEGGVLGIVYLASFMPFQDETIFQLTGGEWLPYVKADRIEEGIVSVQNEMETFFNDCPPELAKRVTATLKPHSERAIKTAPSAIGWQDKAYDGRRAYIRCLQDKALPIEIQDSFIARSGVEWVVKTLDCSHSPFLSMPDELTAEVAEIVGEFARS